MFYIFTRWTFTMSLRNRLYAGIVHAICAFNSIARVLPVEHRFDLLRDRYL